jgi:hypothetical protein
MRNIKQQGLILKGEAFSYPYMPYFFGSMKYHRKWM